MVSACGNVHNVCFQFLVHPNKIAQDSNFNPSQFIGSKHVLRPNRSLLVNSLDSILVFSLSVHFNCGNMGFHVTENIFFSFFKASAPASLIVITLKLDILCYSSIDFPVAAAVSELVIPGLADQMIVMKRIIASEITQQAQVCDLFNVTID